eukprot:3023295-Alexandrium_andersonii.AAC.1
MVLVGSAALAANGGECDQRGQVMGFFVYFVVYLVGKQASMEAKVEITKTPRCARVVANLMRELCPL